MKNVGAKVLKVIGSVNGLVAKSGYNAFQKYNYVMEKDLLDAVREELVKNKLLITMSVESIERNKDLTTVRTKHTILDVDSGETLEVWSAGEGKDSTKDDVGGDKACPKAITSASKYFWLKFFLLSGNDDPENDSKDSKSPQPQHTKPGPKPSGYTLKPQTSVEETKPSGTKPSFGVGKAKPPTSPEPQQTQEDPGF